MKIAPVNMQTGNLKNTSFGLNVQHLSKYTLVDYWHGKDFSDIAINKAMFDLQNYAKSYTGYNPLANFVLSIFNPSKVSSKNLSQYPIVFFDKIQADKFVECRGGNINNQSLVKKVVTTIPNVVYSFQNSSVKYPLLKQFSTPLEKVTGLFQGERLTEPIAPSLVVKDIIKNFKIFNKEKQAPNQFFKGKVVY